MNRSKLLALPICVMLATAVTACASPEPADQQAVRTTEVVTKVVTSVAAQKEKTTEAAIETDEETVADVEQEVTTEEAAAGGNTGAVMPDVVCMNLQDAQNKIQTAGVFYSRSEDATGKGRNQIVDSNWIVVSQTPSPGSAFGEGDAVLSVVKIGEANSC